MFIVGIQTDLMEKNLFYSFIPWATAIRMYIWMAMSKFSMLAHCVCRFVFFCYLFGMRLCVRICAVELYFCVLWCVLFSVGCKSAQSIENSMRNQSAHDTNEKGKKSNGNARHIYKWELAGVAAAAAKSDFLPKRKKLFLFLSRSYFRFSVVRCMLAVHVHAYTSNSKRAEESLGAIILEP